MFILITAGSPEKEGNRTAVTAYWKCHFIYESFNVGIQEDLRV